MSGENKQKAIESAEAEMMQSCEMTLEIAERPRKDEKRTEIIAFER